MSADTHGSFCSDVLFAGTVAVIALPSPPPSIVTIAGRFDVFETTTANEKSLLTGLPVMVG